jgi:hypothetical protein
MNSETITNIIISVLCSLFAMIFGSFFHIYWHQRINKIKKYNEIILNNEIVYLKEKLDIYWSIYFKLLICMNVTIQIKKIKETSNEFNNRDIIIKNFDDIISIIIKNSYNLDMDDYLLDLILRFISYVFAYKCICQSNIKKSPSEYGFPFPDEFIKEITRRVLLIQSKYNEYSENKYDSKKIKDIKYLNISLNHIESKTNIKFQQKFREIFIKMRNIPDNMPTNIDQNLANIPTNIDQNLANIPTNIDQNLANIPTNINHDNYNCIDDEYEDESYKIDLNQIFISTYQNTNKSIDNKSIDNKKY